MPKVNGKLGSLEFPQAVQFASAHSKTPVDARKGFHRGN
jgi:hypothetical protein